MRSVSGLLGMIHGYWSVAVPLRIVLIPSRPVELKLPSIGSQGPGQTPRLYGAPAGAWKMARGID